MNDKYSQPVYDMSGDGLKDVFKSILNKFFPKRKSGLLPPKVRSLLAKIGNERITSLQIVRTPIESVLYTILNLVTLDAFRQWIKRNGYDAVFHLSVYINGRYTLQKNEVIDMQAKSPIKKGSEVMTVVVPQGYSKSIIQVLNTTREQMGDQAFTSYDPWTNNCQTFVLAFTKASGLLTVDLTQFIEQPVEDLVQRIPSFLQKFGSDLVDIAARLDKLVEGEGIVKNKEDKFKSCVKKVAKDDKVANPYAVCKSSVFVDPALNKLKRKLKELRVPFKEAHLSDKKSKRFRIVMKDGSIVEFGAKNATTYLDNKDEKKRQSYLARASKQINNQGQKLIDLKYGPSWMSYYVLWGG